MSEQAKRMWEAAKDAAVRLNAARGSRSANISLGHLNEAALVYAIAELASEDGVKLRRHLQLSQLGGDLHVIEAYRADIDGLEVHWQTSRPMKPSDVAEFPTASYEVA